MARGRNQRFTVYDALEAKGHFDDNPANAQSADYIGPQEFPRMLYHPKGDTRITVPAELISTPMGPKLVGQQSELVSQLAKNAEEEKALLAAGWHKHPADAIKAGGHDAPAKSSTETIEGLQAQIAALTTRLNTEHSVSLGKALPAGTQLAGGSSSELDD